MDNLQNNKVETETTNILIIESLENAQYNNKEKTIFTCDVKFSDFDVILPYTLDKNETSKRNDLLLKFINDNNVKIKAYKETAKMLQNAINIKHQELKNIMEYKRNNNTCDYNNDTFNFGETAQSNMLVLLTAKQEKTYIRSATEKTHVFNLEQLQELSSLMVQSVQALYSEYWNLKDNLYKCETIADVEQITWEI